MKSARAAGVEERTARLTILVDPRKKAVFERLCAQDDVTPSQMVRRWIRTYIEEKLGRPWTPDDEPRVPAQAPGAQATPKPRSSKER